MIISQLKAPYVRMQRVKGNRFNPGHKYHDQGRRENDEHATH